MIACVHAPALGVGDVSPRNSRIAYALSCASFLSEHGNAHPAPVRMTNIVLQTSTPDARSTRLVTNPPPLASVMPSRVLAEAITTLWLTVAGCGSAVEVTRLWAERRQG